MLHETRTVTASDGTPLSTEVWLPATQPTGVVRIVHGMAEHAMRYERLAEALTGAGYAVWADDHRGHGKTARRDEDLGHFADTDGWDRVVADQRHLLDAAQAAHPSIPVVTLGHSMGSIIARNTAMLWGDDLAGLVLTGAPGGHGLVGSAGLRVATFEASKHPRRPSPLMTSLTVDKYNEKFEPVRTKSDWLSRDEAEVDKHLADPRSGFMCTAGFFRDMLNGLDRVTRPENLARIPADLPVLNMAGGADPVAAEGNATMDISRAMNTAGVRDVTTTIFEGARHEIFNETNRADVQRTLLQWLASRL